MLRMLRAMLRMLRAMLRMLRAMMRMLRAMMRMLRAIIHMLTSLSHPHCSLSSAELPASGRSSPTGPPSSRHLAHREPPPAGVEGVVATTRLLRRAHSLEPLDAWKAAAIDGSSATKASVEQVSSAKGAKGSAEAILRIR
eukprot:1245164-Pyramimonas_sp.AAC.1